MSFIFSKLRIAFLDEFPEYLTKKPLPWGVC
jgi:hypothetical protein